MFDSKEISFILIVSLVLALTVSMLKSLQAFIYALIFVFVLIIINILAKKITAFYLDSQIKIKLWEISRIGFRAHQHFKNPFPAGAFFPIIFSVLTFGYLTWFASLVFVSRPEIYKAAKRHGMYSFSEIPEFHIGIIAASGIVANLLFAVIGYLIGFSEFARLNLYYAFFNLIPVSDLDGNKIFFGSKILWSLLAIIALLGVAISIVTI